jgi:predicted transcriptional regulator
MGLDMETICAGKRIGTGDKDKRDLLIYMLWKTGRFSNKEIGANFGLTYSAVSQRVKVMNQRLSVEKGLQTQYEALKSLIKVLIKV